MVTMTECLMAYLLRRLNKRLWLFRLPIKKPTYFTLMKHFPKSPDINRLIFWGKTNRCYQTNPHLEKCITIYGIPSAVKKYGMGRYVIVINPVIVISLI